MPRIMGIIPILRTIGAVLLIAIIVACQTALPKNEESLPDMTQPQTSDPTNAPETDVATLTKVLRLNPEPEAARWGEYPLSDPEGLGPTDYAIMAEVKYDEETLSEVRKVLQASSPLESLPYTHDILQEWYSESVKQTLPVDEASSTIMISEPTYDAQLLMGTLSYGGITFVAADGTVFIFVTSR